MGFTEVLTIVFVVLKLLGVISWGWFYVLLPEIIAVTLYIGVPLVIFLLGLIGVHIVNK